ncbi:MAG: protease modulator HflC [Isosphaeraceae bacterium]
MTRIPRKRRRFAALAVLVLAATAVGFSCLVAVDEAESVLITDFGRVARAYGPGEAGLHTRWPWQSAIRVDRRLRVLDAPSREILTADKRNIDVSPYIAWRVADPLRFVRSAGSVASAEARLSERVSASLSASVGRRELSAMATTDAAAWQLDAIMAEVRDAVSKAALEELGIEVVDARLRRFNFPVEVRPSVFEVIRSERRRVAAELRAEGEARYLEITSRAERDRDTILAEADADAERIRGRGDAEATRLLNEAHAKDPRFYEFVRTLETYRALLDDKTTVILSASSPLLQLLTHGPGPGLLEAAPPPRTPSESGPAAGGP